jgi:D-aminoacyl-tRNA deacylase
VRAVAQRVSRCSVRVAGRTVGEIGRGLLVYLGVARGDTDADVAAMVEKVCNLRVFPDAAGTMNRSLAEEGHALLAVSQFTLLGDVRRGRRPSYSDAAPPEAARGHYARFLELVASRGIVVAAGVFQEQMEVDYVNDGPVTILIDTCKTF